MIEHTLNLGVNDGIYATRVNNRGLLRALCLLNMGAGRMIIKDVVRRLDKEAVPNNLSYNVFDSGLYIGEAILSLHYGLGIVNKFFGVGDDRYFQIKYEDGTLKDVLDINKTECADGFYTLRYAGDL